MNLRTAPPQVILEADTVINRLVDLGVEYRQLAGYVWRRKNGEELTEADEALNVLVMRVVNEEFQIHWAHRMMADVNSDQ